MALNALNGSAGKTQLVQQGKRAQLQRAAARTRKTAAQPRMTVLVQAATHPTAASAAASTLRAPCPVDFSNIRGVLFDIDGTLCNSDPTHFKAFQEILVELGYNSGSPIDEAFFRAHIAGRHNPEIAADLFPDWPEERRTAFYMDKEERFRNMARSGLVPLEGLLQFTAWIDKRGLRKAAVTNAPRANAEMMISGLGLQSFFEHLVLGEECTRAKPHPDPYQAAMDLLGLAPGECVVLEDSPSGVRAGVAAGVPVIGLTSGQSEEALRSSGACWVVADFRDVVAAVGEQGLLP